MTIYYQDAETKEEAISAWRIPQAIHCQEDCLERSHLDEVIYGESRRLPICLHPRAEGKRGGWLKECPRIEEIFRKFPASIPLVLLHPSAKPLGVKSWRWLLANDFRVQSIDGSSTGVITFADGRRGSLFVKLSRRLKGRVEVWKAPENADER